MISNRNKFLIFCLQSHFIFAINYTDFALVAEQVDAADLKSVGRKAVPVRFRPSAPIKKVVLVAAFFVGWLYQSIEPAQCRFDYKRKRYGGIAVSQRLMSAVQRS